MAQLPEYSLRVAHVICAAKQIVASLCGPLDARIIRPRFLFARGTNTVGSGNFSAMPSNTCFKNWSKPFRPTVANGGTAKYQ